MPEIERHALRVHGHDSGEVEVVTTGRGTKGTLVFHHGTPSAGAIHPALRRAAAARGYGVVAFSRPGYGASTARAGRLVVANAPITAAVLDHLGIDEFVSLGWSGGGPHALADGAALAPRCRAVATLASVAPYGADGLDWSAGMAQENLDEFGAALEGREVLEAMLAGLAPLLRDVDGLQLAEALGGLLSEVDHGALDAEMAEFMASGSRRALETGTDGWRDDDLAFVTGWGFAIRDVAVPVSCWQGDADNMVPFAHGRWLADRLPAVLPHLLTGEGHISIWQLVDDVCAELVALGSR